MIYYRQEETNERQGMKMRYTEPMWVVCKGKPEVQCYDLQQGMWVYLTETEWKQARESGQAFQKAI